MRVALRRTATVVALLALYAVIPVPGQRGPVVTVLLSAAVGLGLLGWCTVALARQARSPGDRTAVRLEALVALLYAFLVFMSLLYLGLSSRPGQFVGLDNRIDALYFTMTTVATVGYGDVHAVGTAARAIVTAQIFFDLVFLAVLARTVIPDVARGRRVSPAAGEARSRGAAEDHVDDIDHDLRERP